MNKKFSIPIAIFAILVTGLAILRFPTPEDTWLCSNGEWTRHGNPSAAMPTTVCPGAVTNNNQSKPIGLANPASVNCTDKGGTLVIEKRPDGGEFGVCYFEDNRQCEEWALMRGDCPIGGRKVTGYVTEAGRYCAITGGTYLITSESNSETEKGTCTLVSGQICEAEAYYGGSCPVNE